MSSVDDHPEYGLKADFTLSPPRNCPRRGVNNPPGLNAGDGAERFDAMAFFTALAAPAGGGVLASTIPQLRQMEEFHERPGIEHY